MFPFGSDVKGTATKTSDFDLTVLTDSIGNVDYSYHNLLKSWTGADKDRNVEENLSYVSGHEHALFVLNQIKKKIQYQIKLTGFNR